MIILKSEASTHWYLPDGKPFYEIENKSKPGMMRKVTLRDARKVNAVPSVTGITKMKFSRGLQNWINAGYIMAAATTPRFPDESDEVWVHRVVESADEEARLARETGTGGHDDLENFIVNGYIPVSTPQFRYVNALIRWMDSEEIVRRDCEVEQSFSTLIHGYGGRVDLVVPDKGIVADYKFTKSTPGKPMATYIEYGYQLAAYVQGLDMPRGTRLLSLLFSKTEPGRMEVKDWTDDRQMLWEGFSACLTLWQQEHKYIPTLEETSDEVQ